GGGRGGPEGGPPLVRADPTAHGAEGGEGARGPGPAAEGARAAGGDGARARPRRDLLPDGRGGGRRQGGGEERAAEAAGGGRHGPARERQPGDDERPGDR